MDWIREVKMCFAVNQANKAELDKQLLLWPKGDLPLVGWTPKRWMDAFAHPQMPIILNDRTVELAEWGLIPVWTKDDADAKVRQNQTLNARAETLHELPSFRGSASKKRCLIPVNGFFEYQHLNKGGEPDPEGKVTKLYGLFVQDKPVFYLGGLWSEHADEPHSQRQTADAGDCARRGCRPVAGGRRRQRIATLRPATRRYGIGGTGAGQDGQAL